MSNKINSALDNYNSCASQPYLGDDKQVNLLLRNHNFAAGINIPVEIKYRTITNPTEVDRYKGSFWENEGYSIKTTIEYISKAVSKITKTEYQYTLDSRYIPEFIVGSYARDEYKLYECNYSNSNDQTAYVLEVQLENIKRKLHNYKDDDSFSGMPNGGEKNVKEMLEQFKWIASVNSIFDLNPPYPAYPLIPMKNLIDSFPGITGPDILINSDEIHKLEAIITHVFSSASRVANMKFIPVLSDANLEFRLKVLKSSSDQDKGIKEGGQETFYYENGKTIYTEYNNRYYLSNHSLSEQSWQETFHELSHPFIDHPNDSVFAPEYKLNNKEAYSREFSTEYRADNACMSVMAFTQCTYQGVSLQSFSYLPIDIKALQHIYGANKLTEIGDTNYIFSNNQVYINNIDNPMFAMDIPDTAIYTLYDAGGINTLDLSAVTEPVIIDLDEGASHFNKVGNGVFLIDYSTHIHNVIIGSVESSVRLNTNEANKIFVPAKGAHVTIGNIGVNDKLILSSDANKGIKGIDGYGCIQPYSEIGDFETEICIPVGSYIDVTTEF